MKYDFTFTVRCNTEKLNSFKKWCKKANKEYQGVIREVMEAAPEGRLSIKQSEEHKKTLEELYE